MMRNILQLCSLIAVVIFMPGCTGPDTAGGGTIETTNGIVGTIYNSDGTPASDVVVKLFSDTYDPVADIQLQTGFTGTTDSHGTYRFNRITPGSYTLVARSSDAVNGFLESGIAVTNDSLTTVTDGTLLLHGSVAAVFSSETAVNGGYAYIPGTDIFSPVGNDGSVLLTDVPPGTVQVIMFTSTDIQKRNILRNDIIIAPGDTATIDHPLWSHHRRLFLNTTAAGADVSGTVSGFPVLIRLNNENFDFTQAKMNGGDLSFTDSTGKPLSFEIERWDAAALRAELWVRTDTIFGNDSTQSITMYWGNPDAPYRSSAPAVFDTAEGFAGVWHLDGSSSDTFSDATANGYYGISPDSSRPRIVEGITGKCCSFNGSGNFITMPSTAGSRLSFPADGAYTVSAWVLLDSLDNNPHLVVAKGYEQYFLRFTYFPANAPVWEFSQFGESDSWQACTTTAAARRWTLLTAVRQGTKQVLYCDGIAVDSLPNSYHSDSYTRDTSFDLSIGKYLQAVAILNVENDSFCFFKGLIDEVRIQRTVQSADWIRLCYMNQRPDDRLVEFR